MGLGDLFKNMFKGSHGSGQAQKCPNCGENITLNMERCPKCGVHIKSMFRRKCVKCKALNDLDAKKCSECGYNFEAEYERSKKVTYTCPICGYSSEAFLTRCPVCNT